MVGRIAERSGFLAIGRAFVFAFAFVVELAGCAAPVTPTLSAPLTAPTAAATVAAVRTVTIRPQDGASVGVNAVLAGLSQPGLRGPASGAEVVIVKHDGNAASIVTPAAGLAPGAHVAVINAAATNIVLQN
jgi:hypothetical protein